MFAKVKNFRPEDKDALIALWYDCGLIAGHDEPEKDIREALKEKHCRIFLAEANQPSLSSNGIVGSILAAHDGIRARLYRLAVRQNLRGRGIGRMLVEAGEDWLSNQDFNRAQVTLRSNNLAVEAFYARLGYSPNHSRTMQKWLPADAQFEAFDNDRGAITQTVTRLRSTTPVSHPRVTPLSEHKLAFMRLTAENLNFHRFLYKSIGAASCWTHRRQLSDQELGQIITDDSRELFVLL
ncbi:MAG: GNAT family N-acetyltransferase, partial [Kiloniellales bacterium]|nr:GNAT family N-acetyltransferase [Kiloniellales bacterium]